MPKFNFPPLPLPEWQSTRDTLQKYVHIVTAIRGGLTPPEKHWGHNNLRVSATGLSTTPIPAGTEASVHSFEVNLNLAAHRLEIANSAGETWQRPLSGQSVAALGADLLAVLARRGIEPKIDAALIADASPLPYDFAAVARFWQVLVQVERIFKQFRAGLRRETSAVQFWPDHFDLAMLWFSGRLVPGQDPANAEYADEQMNFGFSTGDDGIPEPYFYITAYPLPEKLADVSLAEGAYWHTEGWQGAVLKYAALVDASQPGDRLLEFLQTVQTAGSALMR